MIFAINCLLVFVLMFTCDVIWALYFRFVNNKKALPASICGVLLYLFGSAVTIKWVENSIYLIPAVLGAFLGTYITVTVMKRSGS